MFAQSIPVEGYIYESGNRGYLEMVTVQVSDNDGTVFKSVVTDRDGFFTFQAKQGSKLKLKIEKSLYDSQTMTVKVPTDKEKHFVNIELKRSPGYLFEVTIAAEKSIDEDSANGLKGYRIDVYNNTTNKEEFVLEEYNQPVFQVPLIKENHYTILIRKDGYMSKRIEAFVDIEGCILCFEGLGSVGPGVSETLSEQNTIGVLLANVSMVKAYKGKKMQVNDLYYDLGKWDLKQKSKKELDNLATLMKDNPRWIVELGSHTDSRGSDKNNMVLSEKRAKSAVDYLVIEKNIDRTRISAKGYGETNLLNDCNDSKYCAEKEHLINRRTEVQIVGIADKMRYQSLAEIKRSENMDALLQDIQFGEQVMIPVYNAEQDSLLTAKKDSIAKSLLVEESIDIDPVETVMTEQFEDHTDKISELVVENEIDTEIDIQVEELETVEAEITKSIPAATKKKIENVVKESNVENKNSVINDATVDQTEAKVNPVNKSKKSSIDNDLADLKYEKVVSHPDDKKVVDSQPKTSKENKAKVEQAISKSTAMIKIVLMETTESLSKSHDLFKTHNDVKEIYHNGKFKYLFGEFNTMDEAKNFLNQSIKMVYPNAYVVKFN